MLVLNGLAAVCAVSHHASVWAITAMFWWADQYRPTSIPNYDEAGSLEFLVLRLLDQFSQPAVPAFLFVSGYFVSIAAGPTRRFGWPVVAGRVRYLIPPYVLWSLVIILMNVAVNRQQYSLMNIAGMLASGGATPPFYYVPLLVQLYVLSPFFTALASRRGRLVLVLSGLVHLSIICASTYSMIGGRLDGQTGGLLRFLLNWNLTTYSFWFILGQVAGFHLTRFKDWMRRIRPALPWIVGLLSVAALVEWELLRRASGRPWIPGGLILSDNLLSLVLLLTFFAFEDRPLPYAEQLGRIGPMSYGIYLIHVPVLEIFARSIYHGAPSMLAYQIWFQFLLIAAGVGIPLLIMAAVRATPLRRYYAYAFG
jgi:surface polysaccharide O-acyltransferase-like enzyme